MNVFKRVKVVVSQSRNAMRAWNSTDVYLVTGLVIGFVVWLVMGVFLIHSVLKVVLL